MAVREVSSAPGTATLYPKALLGSTVVPLARRVPLLGGRLGGGRGRELPDTELVRNDLAIDREHLTAYARVCGFGVRDELPATYPHILAFPLSMALMTDLSFPFGVIGLVHVRNEITQLRPVGADEPLSLRVGTEGPAEHERGTAFDVVAEATVAGEAVWRGRSTYLHREGGGGSGSKERDERPEPPQPSAVWKLPGDLGRRYARVSGDANPIHLNGLAAKALGLPGTIAHGMWTKARCLAALEAELPPAFTVDVAFKLPVRLPGRVAFATWAEGDGRAFAVHEARGAKPHLQGSVTAA